MLPLLRVLASEPDALVEHAAAYADLASDEWQQLQVHWAQRLLWLAIAAVAALARPGARGCYGRCRWFPVS